MQHQSVKQNFEQHKREEKKNPVNKLIQILTGLSHGDEGETAFTFLSYTEMMRERLLGQM